MAQQCVCAVERTQQPAVIGVLLLMSLMIPRIELQGPERSPFIYSKIQSVVSGGRQG